MMIKPRVGHISFINCLPLTYSFAHGPYARMLAVHDDVPAGLNRQIVAGELDISPVSSIIYAQHADKFLLLPGLSISANGALQSILLVTKRPIDSLGGCRTALTAKSATSHGLLKIILDRLYGVRPEYFISTLSLDGGVLDDAEAALFIGDDALYAYHHRQDGLHYYDIGEEWKKLTGGAMVYAVWVVNRTYAEANAEQVATVWRLLKGGLQYGLSRLEDAAATLTGKFPFTVQQICHYLQLLNYDMTSAHQAALLNYYRYAWEIGLIDQVPALEFFEVKA
ncbi:MAG: menaquinone biosynthesis protein [Negativicutes bacterium]|nr:menaquinone biosynthesis protein [Negativicutes bacterium]